MSPYTIPIDLDSFITAAGESIRNSMYALSAAESLTDEIAVQLSELSGMTKCNAMRFVKALHFSDFVIERNSEWHLSSQCKNYLREELQIQHALFIRAHSLLFEISTTGDPKEAGETIPRYLLSDVGKAFHKSPISPAEGLELYAKAARQELSGSQWLLGRLAIEQQDQGILPIGAIEPPFLRGMTLYKEGRLAEAETYLKRIVNSDEVRVEVAISCHLVGRILSKRGIRTEAEALLKRSLELLITLNDQDGQGQVLNTLGHHIGKNRKRIPEAEKLLRESLEIREKLNDNYGRASTLLTLGLYVGRDSDRFDEAEDLLKLSLKLDETPYGRAQILNALGRHIGKDPKRAVEAEHLLKESLEIGQKINHRKHQAIALRTLGQHIGKDPNRATEAEALLKRSLEIGKKNQ